MPSNQHVLKLTSVPFSCRLGTSDENKSPNQDFLREITPEAETQGIGASYSPTSNPFGQVGHSAYVMHVEACASICPSIPSNSPKLQEIEREAMCFNKSFSSLDLCRDRRPGLLAHCPSCGD